MNNSVHSPSRPHQMPAQASEISSVRLCKIVAATLGLTLLFASILKMSSRSLPINLDDGFFNNWWVLAIAALIELIAGAILLSGLWPKPSWLLGLLLFAVFGCVALYKTFNNSASCGCFGDVHVPPQYMAAFDLCAVVALLFTRRGALLMAKRMRYEESARRAKLAFLIMSLSTGIVVTIYAMSFTRDASIDESGFISSSGTVVLDPANWVGRRFALSNHIDIGKQLDSGQWLLVLYRSDCSHCREVVPRYAARARDSEHIGTLQIAFIEMSSSTEHGEELVHPDSRVHLGRLSSDHNWFAQTPVTLVLKNGSVLHAIEGDDASTMDNVFAMALQSSSPTDSPTK